MIPPQKIIEIKQKLRRGYPQGELINELADEGYSDEEIREALFELEGPKSDSKIKDLPLWYMASICFIVLGIAILTVRWIWIYDLGWVFLILGLAGVCVKHVIIDYNKKNEP